MYNPVHLADLKSSTRIFSDFINFEQKNIHIDLETVLNNLSNQNYNRKLLIEIIRATCQNFNLSDSQDINLEKLNSDNTFAVVTGQQAGFLGGPVYTLFKALDTIIYSQKLSKQFPDKQFVPIFWIEDNDNDLEESSLTYLFDKDNYPVELKLSFQNQTTVSDAIINDDSIPVINNAVELLNTLFPNGKNIAELVEKIYTPGAKWSDAFTSVMQFLLGDSGLLFISAAKLVSTGIFNDIVLRELSETGATKTIIEKRNNELLSLGYHLQANASEINLFYHKDSNRFKIEKSENSFIIDNQKFAFDELIKLAESNPENFSPKVLLRPIFQDYAIPTAIYIGGAAEIAYQSQMYGLYDYFNIVKPAILMRRTLTLIDKKSSRYLSKLDKEPHYFMNDFKEIERELASELLGEKHNLMFSDFKSEFESSFNKISDYLLSIDNQLDRTIAGAKTKIYEQIEQLDKKAHSLAKRNNDEILSKYNHLSRTILPNGKLQERVVSPLYFASISENFIETLKSMDFELSENHYFVNL